MGKLLNSTEQAWCDDLLLRLRLRDVPGTRIGEVLAEVQSHVAETGEHPREAFGSPKQYADEVAAALGIRPAGPLATLRGTLTGWDVLVALLTGLGGFALADGLWSLAAGDASLLGLPAWAVAAAGALVLAACTARFVLAARRGEDADPVLDPRTGADTAPFTRGQVALLAGVPVLLLAMTVVGGLLTR
ncbi:MULTISPECIES: HAAS signaling domain-containing protein [unclassified Blastococcus]